MGKADRKRWEGNVKSMEIIAKPTEEISEADVEFLRQNYTSAGGLLPNAFSGGAFFTPTHVAKFIWDILKPRLPANAKVLEPSVGSGVFLEHAPVNAQITALELDKTSAKVTSILYPQAEVIEGNALVHERRDYYDLVIGNPPYGVSVEFPDTGEDWASLGKASKGVRKGKSEVAFIELAIKAAKPGGYIAFVLPKGISFANYAAKLRQLMHETCWQVATIFLPGETFQHVGTTIETQIIIVRKVTPTARMIEPATKRWGSNFRRSEFYSDITEFNAKFYEGQTPAYFAKVTDIGWDAKGKSTDKWGDGLTQLDELVDNFTDTLVRENLYPHIPSWHGLKDVTSFFFSNGNDTCDGHRDASETYADGPYRWNELTLGAGDEVVWQGEERSTFDFDWQDEIVAKYYNERGEK